MNTNWLETFADGVFAIAATLLILNVDAQVTEDVPDLGGRLLHIWPSYAAYVVTFFTIGIVWVNIQLWARHAQREDASGCLSCARCDRGCRWDVSQLSIDWGGVQVATKQVSRRRWSGSSSGITASSVANMIFIR